MKKRKRKLLGFIVDEPIYCDDSPASRPVGNPKTRADVIEALGPPDRILSPREGIRALRWVCSKCRHIFIFDKAVRPPAPCEYCGGIAFETNTQRGFEHVRTN